MSIAEAIATPWRRASLAATVFALDPLGGGLRLRAGPGPARETLLARLGEALAPRKILRIPAEIADDRLLGGLDVAATLRTGKPVAEAGVLAGADGGVLVVAMAERMRGSVAARLAAALDQGEAVLQRDGLSLTLPARFGLVALDEGRDDESAPPSLTERCGYWLELDEVARRDVEPALFSEHELARARALLPTVEAGDAAVEALVAIGAALGVASLRAPLFALRAARALAALREADAVEEEDIDLAAALVLGPRATRIPPPPQASAAEDEPADEDEPTEADGAESQAGEDDSAREVEASVQEAARAAVPPGLLASLAEALARPMRASSEGKAGAESYSRTRGRPLDARPGPLASGRLALVETLRAAAPWRRLRDLGAEDSRRIIVRPEDFRIQRYRQRRGATTIFVLDASGSLALNRLAEVKGAIELLLADCYVRRDEVALVAFRGKVGEIALPPTRSTARARRALAGLAGGGGTPIAAGLDAALALAEAVRRKGQTPLIVLMTDGRANIARDGTPGRARATQDALESARSIRASRFAALAIDAGGPASRDDAARGLAEAMSARYLKLPVADAARVNAAVRSARPS